MMGFKERHFDPIDALTLDDLVPADHFYRYLDRAIDLSFVRDLVAGCYAAGGRPSIDPVVFFKLQLVLFFEGLRSERQLLQHAADRLSVRWYLGYDLTEPLPNHSSLTRIRDRYGIDIFRRFFDAIVTQCRDAGLVWGRELYLDATIVEANASLDSLMPRFAIEAHLEAVFAASNPPDDSDTAASLGARTTPLPIHEGGDSNGTREPNWLVRNGRPDRSIVRGHYQRRSDYEASRTDPDASLLYRPQTGLRIAYHDHYVVDGGRARIILTTLVTPAEVMENQPALDLLWHSCFRWRLWPWQVTADTTYATGPVLTAIEDAGIRAYLPLPNWDRGPLFGPSRFTYDAAKDVYRCPAGHALQRYTERVAEGTTIYRAAATTCNACPLKACCTTSSQGRMIHRAVHAPYVERIQTYQHSAAYQKAIRKRRVWVEPLFGEAKQWHGLEQFRLRGLVNVNGEALLTATGQNLKRLLSSRGWGRRPFPSGAGGVRLSPVGAWTPHSAY